MIIRAGAKHRIGFCLAVVMYFSAAWPTTAWAQPAPDLPNSVEQWINTPPLSNEMLRGKAVFLWFFEET